MELDQLPETTPVLVGAGQVVRREITDESPMQLAAEAARRALEHAAGEGVAAAIDTLSVTRLFADSMGMPPCPFGRSNNPPRSVAQAIGANPAHYVYGPVGGNDPQSRLIEFAGSIARGERSVVLLCGAEAIRNQRSAQRDGRDLEWNEHFDELAFPLEDRGWGDFFVTMQEVHNGLLAPMAYYALIEQARAFAAGRSVEEHRQHMAALLQRLNSVATSQTYAQFPTAMTATDILGADPLNHLYSKRMVAQDSVNQGAALVLCSVGAARELGIPEEHWVFMHALAEGADVNLSERVDLTHSAMVAAVFERVFAYTDKTVDDIKLIDLYSCFPCAVTASAEILGIEARDAATLSLTGGLAFFGGAGNNYSMHALAEAVSQLRESPEEFALVAALGGFLSKHAVGLFSCIPCALDWSREDTKLDNEIIPRKEIDAAPTFGEILSYVVNYQSGAPGQAIVIAETDQGKRFVAHTTEQATIEAVLNADKPGTPISVAPGEKEALLFSMASA
ncbi:MAG: hypothetical protein AAGI44_18455 [Pseudomonadota bacterium]